MAFGFGEAGVGFGGMVEPAEEGDPGEAEEAGDEEGGAPVVEEAVDGEDDEWGDGAADGSAGRARQIQ